MKLKVGKSYKNRGGEKVTIVSFFQEDDNPYGDEDGATYKANGKWDCIESEHDLISEWEEPEQPTIGGTYLFVRALRAFEAMPNTERKAALAYLNERFKGE